VGKPFEKRTWAIESAGGLGYLLAQQLVDAGEHVLDVPATLASRVRVFGTGKSDKNDPNDARSVAVAALRSPGLRSVQAANHADVLRLLAKRTTDLGSLRTKLGAESTPISPHWPQAELPRNSTLLTPMGSLEHSSRPRQPKRSATSWPWSCWIKLAVRASGTSLTDVYGIGPVLACALIGYTGDISRFKSRDQFAAYNGTAPVEVSSGGRVTHRLSRRGNRQLNHAVHMVAICQIRQTDSDGRIYFEKKVAEGKTKKDAIRSLKRQISNTVYRQLVLDARQ
jgi:transposase